MLFWKTISPSKTNWGMVLEIVNDRVPNVNMWVGSLSHWLVRGTDDHHTTYKLVPRTGTPLQVWKAQLLTGSLVLSALFFLLDCLGAAGHFFLAVLQACCCHFGRPVPAVCAGKASASSAGPGGDLCRATFSTLAPRTLWTRNTSFSQLSCHCHIFSFCCWYIYVYNHLNTKH